MKIPESIIDKFDLRVSKISTGCSVINKQRIFESGNIALYAILFMECDLNGGPSKYINVINQETKSVYECTPEFLEDLTVMQHINMIRKQLGIAKFHAFRTY